MNHSKKQKLYLLVTIIGIAFLAVIGYFAYAYHGNDDTSHSGQSTSDSEAINFSKPTDDEISEGQEAKKNDYEHNNDSESNPQGKKNISIGIAFASFDANEDVVDIRAFTPDIIEGDGVCTATLTRESITVEETSKAFIDFSSSQCEPIAISRDRFNTGGAWKLIVSYSSSTSTGLSAPMTVELPE